MERATSQASLPRLVLTVGTGHRRLQLRRWNGNISRLFLDSGDYVWRVHQDTKLDTSGCYSDPPSPNQCTTRLTAYEGECDTPAALQIPDRLAQETISSAGRLLRLGDIFGHILMVRIWLCCWKMCTLCFSRGALS